MKVQGFTITELLLALFLMSLISAMLFTLYFMHQRLYWHVQQEAEVLLEVQWVEELLTNSIRRAGFTPCLSIDNLEVIDTRTSKNKRFLGLSIEKEVTVQRMSEQFGELLHQLGSSQILVSKDALLAKKTLLIADCYHAEIHDVLALKNTKKGVLVTLDKPVIFQYPDGAYVGEWIKEQWFSKRNKAGHLALYYKKERSEELTSLIHSMTCTINTSSDKQEVSIQLASKYRSYPLSIMVRV